MNFKKEVVLIIAMLLSLSLAYSFFVPIDTGDAGEFSLDIPLGETIGGFTFLTYPSST